MIIKPSRLCLSSVTALLVLAIALGSAQALAWPVPLWLPISLTAVYIALVLLAVFDAWLAYRQAAPTFQRQLPQSLSLGRYTEVQLNISHPSQRRVVVEYFDHLPDSFEFAQLPHQVTLQPGHINSTHYRIKPLQRGRFLLNNCALRMPSPLRLWTAQYLLQQPNPLRVYPDFSRLQSGELQATEQWLNQLGVQQQQRRGSGLEFHQLREFRADDSLRHIDWKATARKRTPIAREYQDERDQQVIFLLDCGRSMRSHDGALSHLDHALNACLLLAYTALRQGDAVGVHTFAGEQRRIAPRKGRAHMSVLLNGLYDIQASQESADYSTTVKQFLVMQKRRALVIVISNLADEADSDLVRAMQQLKKHHRTLLVSLREEVLDQVRAETVDHYQQALLYCGGVDYALAKQRNQQRLLSQGIDVVDVRPSQLTGTLISQYLQMKKSGHY